MEDYKSLLSARDILRRAGNAVWENERDSSAWLLVIHAMRHIEKQMDAVLRGE